MVTGCGRAWQGHGIGGFAETDGHIAAMRRHQGATSLVVVSLKAPDGRNAHRDLDNDCTAAAAPGRRWIGQGYSVVVLVPLVVLVSLVVFPFAVPGLGRRTTSRRASAARSFCPASRHRIAAHPSGEITE